MVKYLCLPRRALLCALLPVVLSAGAQHRQLDWLELLPAQDYAALLTAPPINHEGGDTGLSQPVPLRSSNESSAVFGRSFEQALVCTAVRTELDGQQVRLPGFVVPLEYDANQNVTEFFLVPYFGACIHMPPPPPNQIIHVIHASGFALDSIQKPFTVTGVLHTAVTSNDTALSAYRITAAGVEPWRE